MEFPKDAIELENIRYQAKDEGDARAEMLASFAMAAVDDAERSRITALGLTNDVRDMLDRIESWQRSGWVAERDVGRVRDMVNGILHGPEEGELAASGEPEVTHTESTTSLNIPFKSHWIMRMHGYAFAQTLKKPDGTYWNFIEMKLTDREMGPMTLTLQRVSGETPNQQIARLNDQIKMLEGALDRTQYEASVVYAHVTGGKVTNASTPAHEVIAAADEVAAEKKQS